MPYRLTAGRLILDQAIHVRIVTGHPGGLVLISNTSALQAEVPRA